MDFKQIGRSAMYALKKHSPTLFLVGGLVGTTCGVVMACKATTELEPIIDEHKAAIEDIHAAAGSGLNGSEYTEKDEKQDLTKTYIGTGFKLVKLYAPSALTIIVSYGCIFNSHRILTKRNIALGAAYTTLNSMWNQYRENIIDKYGEEVDKEARYSIKAKKVKHKDGTQDVKYEITAKTNSNNNPSDYARFFDETNVYWIDNAEYNLMFLKRIEQFCNEKLRKDGILFLNDVYKALGFKVTKAGQVVGWRYNPKNPNIDNYVSFNIYDMSDPAKRDFVNGYEKCILLDFNCDGNIWADMAEDIDNPKSIGNWMQDMLEFGGMKKARETL